MDVRTWSRGTRCAGPAGGESRFSMLRGPAPSSAAAGPRRGRIQSLCVLVESPRRCRSGDFRPGGSSETIALSGFRRPRAGSGSTWTGVRCWRCGTTRRRARRGATAVRARPSSRWPSCWAVTDQATAERCSIRGSSGASSRRSGPLGAGRRRCHRLAGSRRRGRTMSCTWRWRHEQPAAAGGAHLPAASPERRETVAGECLDCLAQFAIDVRLPLPATSGTAGPTCSLARTSVGRSTRCGSGGWNDDVALHRGAHQLIELAERRRGRGTGRCAARRARCRAAGVVERKV